MVDLYSSEILSTQNNFLPSEYTSSEHDGNFNNETVQSSTEYTYSNNNSYKNTSTFDLIMSR